MTAKQIGASPKPARATDARAEWRDLRDPAVQRALVARIRAGDVAAFEVVFRGFQEALTLLAARVTSSDHVGAEVVQEVFLKIWRTRETWEPTTTLTTYLFVMTRNAALNVARRSALESKWQTPYDGVDGAEHGVADDAAGPDALVEGWDREAALARAVGGLSERVREAFVLRWRDQLTYAEVAATLGVSVKTVEKRLGRAFVVLRRALKPWLSGDL